jgi:hypothetical protein
MDALVMAGQLPEKSKKGMNEMETMSREQGRTLADPVYQAYQILHV